MYEKEDMFPRRRPLPFRRKHHVHASPPTRTVPKAHLTFGSAISRCAKSHRSAEVNAVKMSVSQSSLAWYLSLLETHASATLGGDVVSHLFIWPPRHRGTWKDSLRQGVVPGLMAKPDLMSLECYK